MYEFDSVSVSTFEASTLAAKLTEKSGDGWDVVAVVPTGSDITAFLKRKSERSSPASASAPAASSSSWAGSSEPAAASAPSEPAGWGTAPAASSTGSWGPSSSSSSSTEPGGTSSWSAGAQTPTSGGSAWGSQPSSAPSAPAAAPATPAVPAGWYSDPANRFELRYWDGSAWTEHVSRAGQQYTDPPVA